MSKQPYTRTGTCKCGATFQAKDQWQRSCEACIDARIALEEAKPPKVCRRCRVERTDCRWGLCLDCRAAKEQERQAWLERERAKQLERNGYCRHCDSIADNGTDGLCWTCERKEKRAQEWEQRQAQRRQEVESEPTAAPRVDIDDDPAVELAVAIMLALASFVGEHKGKTEPTPIAKEVQPDPRQEHCDRVAASLLEGIEL